MKLVRVTAKDSMLWSMLKSCLSRPQEMEKVKSASAITWTEPELLGPGDDGDSHGVVVEVHRAARHHLPLYHVRLLGGLGGAAVAVELLLVAADLPALQAQAGPG